MNENDSDSFNGGFLLFTSFPFLQHRCILVDPHVGHTMTFLAGYVKCDVKLPETVTANLSK